MSRTGVGIRVLIDGKQLDDGCIDFGQVPWMESRRNLVQSPYPRSLNGYATHGGALTTIALATGYLRVTRIGAGSARLLMIYLGTTMPTGAVVTLKMRARAAIAGQTLTAYARPDVVSGTGAATLGTWTTTTAYQTVELSAVFTGVPGPSSGIAILITEAFTTQTTFDFHDIQVELTPPPLGAVFDGETPDTETERYSWTGVAEASPSIQEVPAAVPAGVFASDGLSVTWGRTTTVDQPEPSSCNFRVIDEPGGSTVLQTIKLGARVDVFADAVIAGNPVPTDAFVDPSFNSAVRASVSNAVVKRTQTRADEAGGWSAQITATSPTLAAIATMPPGVVQAEGTNPLAWIGLQSTNGGETWTIRARVWIASGVQLQMQPVAYSGPYASAASVLNYPVSAVGTGSWIWLERTFAPGLEAAWIGLRFESSGGGRWADVPDAQTWATIDATGATWADLSDVWIDRVEILGPTGAAAQSVLVFSGRITDLEGFYAQDWDQPALTVTATDFLGDLGNRYIGTEPFPLEAVPARVTRILQLGARPGEPAIQVEIAPAFTALPLSWDDVDHSPAAGLLTEIAQSIDGVLWSATHPVIGPYIRLEDPAERLPLYELRLNGGVIVIGPADFTNDPDAPPNISACDILRDPVRFTMDVSDLASQVGVSWLFQTVDEDSNPTTEQRRITVEDPARITLAGVRAVNVESIVTTSADAYHVADAILARLGASWRISGVAVADADLDVPDSAAAEMLMLLLNGVTRGGQPLQLTDLPSWSPTGTTAPIYLEGGVYSFVEGGWDLELTVSRAAGQGSDALWDDIPNDAAWKWDAWDPDLTWDQLRGVSGP